MNYFLLSTLTLAWLAILVGGCLGWQLLRQNGRMLLRLDELEKRLNELEFGEDHEPGLPVGSAAPDFELADLASDTRTLAQYRGYPVLLVFFNPACGFCRELLPKLSALYGVRRQAERNAALGTLSELNGQDHSAAAAGVLQSNGVLSPCGLTPRLLLLSTGGAEANRQIFNEYQLTCPVLLQKESEAATAYQANGTPSGYLISPDGRIASELAIGEEALLELLGGKPERSEPDRRGNQAEMDQSLRGTVGGNGDGRADRFSNSSLARSKIKRDGLKAGTPAPDFRLPRLDGRGDFTLSELRARRVLLVFSSPSCGPCNALAPQLEKFHREHPEMEVVMVTRGEPKLNRAKIKEHGLTFPVVLQQQWEISRRYAIFATPIAYLIDETGVIAQDVAVGTDSILGLIARAGHLVPT